MFRRSSLASPNERLGKSALPGGAVTRRTRFSKVLLTLYALRLAKPNCEFLFGCPVGAARSAPGGLVAWRTAVSAHLSPPLA